MLAELQAKYDEMKRYEPQVPEQPTTKVGGVSMKAYETWKDKKNERKRKRWQMID